MENILIKTKRYDVLTNEPEFIDDNNLYIVSGPFLLRVSIIVIRSLDILLTCYRTNNAIK